MFLAIFKIKRTLKLKALSFMKLFLFSSLVCEILFYNE